MALKIVVSYDDTDNDRDALALGRLLARPGVDLALAYVRHSFGESLDQQAAERLLAHGAESVGTPAMSKYVIVNPATSVGLAELVEQEGIDVLVFGSEYRTANGLVKPGIPAHKLLLGGGSAIAIAPAGLRFDPTPAVEAVAVIDAGDAAARRSAESLAGALGATVVERGSTPAGLLVVGSRPEAPSGKVMLSAASDYAVEAAGHPVLVIPRATALDFGGGLAAGIADGESAAGGVDGGSAAGPPTACQP